MTYPPGGFGFGRRTDWTRERFPGATGVRPGETTARLPGQVEPAVVCACAPDRGVCRCFVTIQRTIARVYRDGFDKCPRCGVALVDARSARGCQQCGGMWVEEAVLEEMVLEMLPPGPLRRLQLEVMQRSEAPIACPSCGEQMHETRIHDVVLDRCPKHGVWFDRSELGAALLHVSKPDAALPLVESPERAPIPAAAAELPLLRFRIATPGQPVREVELRREIIKIGRMASAHVRVDDPRASRMHAIIECSPTEAMVIDLGSTDRTLVNGTAVTRQRLASGDRLLVGATTIELGIEF